jgi:hypothetical protein
MGVYEKILAEAEPEVDERAWLVAQLPFDWEYTGDSMVCPCGNEIEMDGECPNGCRSPLMGLGLI